MASPLFEQAVAFIDSSLKQLAQSSSMNLVSMDEKLQFYALYKQATVGRCTGPRPYFYDIQGRYKYDAWLQLGDLSKETAMSRYVDRVIEFGQKMMSLYQNDGKINRGYDNLRLSFLSLLKNSEELTRKSPVEYVSLQNLDYEKDVASHHDSNIASSSDLERGDEDPLHVKEPREDCLPETCMRGKLAVGDLTENAVCNLIRRLEYVEANLLALEDEFNTINSELQGKLGRLNSIIKLMSFTAAGSIVLYILSKLYLKSYYKSK